MCVLYIYYIIPSSLPNSLRKGTNRQAMRRGDRCLAEEFFRKLQESSEKSLGQGAVQRMLETRHGKHTKNDGKSRLLMEKLT